MKTRRTEYNTSTPMRRHHSESDLSIILPDPPLDLTSHSPTNHNQSPNEETTPINRTIEEHLSEMNTRALLMEIIQGQKRLEGRMEKMEMAFQQMEKGPTNANPLQQDSVRMRHMEHTTNQNGDELTVVPQIPNHLIHTMETQSRELSTQIWHLTSFGRTKEVYLNWANHDPPIIPKKYQPTENSLENETERQIRVDTALNRLKGDINICGIREEKAKLKRDEIEENMRRIILEQPLTYRDHLQQEWEKATKNATDRAETSWKKRESFLSHFSENYKGPFKAPKRKVPRRTKPQNNFQQRKPNTSHPRELNRDPKNTVGPRAPPLKRGYDQRPPAVLFHNQGNVRPERIRMEETRHNRKGPLLPTPLSTNSTHMEIRPSNPHRTATQLDTNLPNRYTNNHHCIVYPPLPAPQDENSRRGILGTIQNNTQPLNPRIQNQGELLYPDTPSYNPIYVDGNRILPFDEFRSRPMYQQLASQQDTLPGPHPDRNQTPHMDAPTNRRPHQNRQDQTRTVFRMSQTDHNHP